MTEDIRIIFVLSECYNEESEASQIMQQAFQNCRQNLKNTDNVQWVKEQHINVSTLNKKDLIVFENFEGETFEKLKQTKCVILGAWAISVCLLEGKQIPNFDWPIYNVAMFDCVVSCTQLPKESKQAIKEKIQLMGGLYTDVTIFKNTHLITDGCKSKKYVAAAEHGIKLMLPSWVDAVWETSQNSNVHAKHEMFNKHQCPPFHKLTICSTGIPSEHEKQNLSKMITQNGGIFSGRLNLRQTDILVCHGPSGTNSEKYKAARKCPQLKCVNIDWVFDSIEKGYALCPDNYQVKKSTSTPTKDGENINPDFSLMSVINGSNFTQRLTLEETKSVNLTSNVNLDPLSPTNTKVIKRKASTQLLEDIDIKRVKRAGHFLDGCSVYIVGFGNDHREKLCKILNISGATRYDSLSERVTHVIVGDVSSSEMNELKSLSYSCVWVHLEWLFDSLEQQAPVNEAKYLVKTTDLVRTEMNSPVNKKGFNLLKSNATLTEKEMNATLAANITVTAEDQEDDNLMKKYLNPSQTTNSSDTIAQMLKAAVDLPDFTAEVSKSSKIENLSKQQTTDTCSVTADESIQPIFEGLTFSINDFDDEVANYVVNMIEAVRGEVVNKSFAGSATYDVYPAFNNSSPQSATTIVNDIWITECLQREEIVDIEYYHQPFVVKDLKPLKNCVVTLSSYAGLERDFLKKLTIVLGGVSQDQFSRTFAPGKGVVASTHLVSFEPSGKKYEAALKWNLPAVNKDWLLECARTGIYVPEEKFLIGKSKSPQNSHNASKPGDASFKTPQNVSKVEQPVPYNHNAPTTSVQDDIYKPVDYPALSSIRDEEKHDKSSKFNTPVKLDFNDSATEKTPLNQIYKFHAKDTPDACSQVTPVNKIIQEARDNNLLGTPESPKTYYPWDPKTPDTPLGAFIRPNPSPNLRKEMQRYINNFPDFEPPKRRLSTPLSEIKKKMWNKILKKDDSGTTSGLEQDNFSGESPLNSSVKSDELIEGQKYAGNLLINNKLQQLEDMLSSSGGGSARRSSRIFQPNIPPPDPSSEVISQKFTVGWDFSEEQNLEAIPRQVKVFMMSGVDSDLRQLYGKHIENLGGIVSDLSNYDPSCTHLVCPKPARNEKTLSCMAAGKWILHTSYIEKSVEAGKFLDEEDFEFGNPKSADNLQAKYDRETEARMESLYWWRKEISRRGYGAFNDMRAIIIANKKESIIRVVEAGGGVVINVKPPFEDTVHATHCLMEPKAVKNFSEYIPLAQQGIFCVNTLYINDFLYRVSKDIRDSILPQFLKYYEKN